MSGRGSRVKGANAERELFKLLNEAIGEDLFRRNLLQTRIGGADNEDPYGDLPLTIEVKRQEKLYIQKWLKQVEEAAKGSQAPVVAYRQNRQPWSFVVSMTFDEFVTYMEKVHGIGQKQADAGATGSVRSDSEAGPDGCDYCTGECCGLCSECPSG